MERSVAADQLVVEGPRGGIPIAAVPASPARGPLPTAPPRQINMTSDTVERHNGAITGPDAVPVVFGRQMVEGRVVAIDTTGPSDRRSFVVVAAGEIYQYVQIYKDGVIVFPTIETRTGNSYQTAISALMAWYGWWGSYYTWPGIAYAHITEPLSAEAPNRWQFLIDGCLVYDTRTATRAFSTNPAMCLRHLLSDVDFGGGIYLSNTSIDDASFEAAANECDTLVSGAKKFELNLAILGEGGLLDWIETICTHFRARLYKRDGKFYLWMDKAVSNSGITFDSSNSRGWRLYSPPLTDVPSRVMVEYPKAATGYVTDRAISEDATSSATREAVYKLEGCVTYAQAQRTADYIRKAAALKKVSFMASPLAARLNLGTRFTLTFPVGTHAATGEILTYTGDFLAMEVVQEGEEYRVEARAYDASIY